LHKLSLSAAFSSGIIPIRKQKFLLLRAYGYWDFPKGLVGPGENPLDAALRELVEETGITQPNFRWGNSFYETEPYSHGKVARYYLAEVADDKVRLSPEHHEARWLAYEEARELLVPRLRKVIDWAWLLTRRV
jgi:bis(5'-nucleosidyl)-tetraphosphatase